MRMNAPAGPPPHRLPVLTEVVQLDDDAPYDAVSAPPSEAPVPVQDLIHGFGLGAIAPSDAHGLPHSMDVSGPPADMPVLVDVAGPDEWNTSGRVPLDAFSRSDAPGATAAFDVAVSVPAPLFGEDLPQPPHWLRRRTETTTAPTAPVALPLPAAAPPSPLPPDFSGSWWTRDDGHVPPDVRVHAPTATPQAVAQAVAPVVPLSSVPTRAVVSETEVVRRVMRDLDGQLDHMFDHRMREVIAPALARAADSLMADLRERLAVTVRDMVARAVTVELARQQREHGDD